MLTLSVILLNEGHYGKHIYFKKFLIFDSKCKVENSSNYQFKKLQGEFPEDNQEQTVEQLLNRKEAIEKLITVSVNKFIDDAEISVKSIELIHFESDRKKILQTKITLDL